MSAKGPPSLANSEKDLRNHIGCMNGIFKLFDTHRYITQRSLDSHCHKRQLHGDQYPLEPHKATKEKEKPRASTESSRASCSSSCSISSTFSSLDYNRTSQAEPRPLEFNDIRNVVKGSLYREVARHLSVESISNEGRKVDVPLQHPNLSKNLKDEMLPLPHFSFDGRELREAFTSMKLSAVESETDFHGGDLLVEYHDCSRVLPFKQEPDCRTPSSSIVTKLMGLDSFPDPGSADDRSKMESSPSPKVVEPSKSSKTSAESKHGRLSFSSQKNPSPLSPQSNNANSPRKPTAFSRLPAEPADSSQGYPRIDVQKGKGSANISNLSPSVYGEIEKRIMDLQFRRCSKDLRALKQTLEAIHRTRECLQNRRDYTEFGIQRSCRPENIHSNQNPILLVCENRKATSHCPPKILGSSTVKTKPANARKKVRNLSSIQVPTTELQDLPRVRSQDPECLIENPKLRRKAKDCTTTSSNMKETSWRLSSPEKKTAQKNVKSVQTIKRTQYETVAYFNSFERGFRMGAPRLQHNVLRNKGEPHPTTLSSHSGRTKKNSISKGRERCCGNKEQRNKSRDLHLSCETRYSSYQGDTACATSETETEGTNLIKLINIHSSKQQASKSQAMSASKEHISVVDDTANITEQPSPVSVLDSTVYKEGPSSPVKKMFTDYQEDESSSPGEVEWHIKNINPVPDGTRSHLGGEYNPRLECMLHLNEPQMSGDHDEAVCRSLNPGHRYIIKILLKSGLLQDIGIITTPNQLHSPCPLINPYLFDILEETEAHMEEANGELDERSNHMKLNQKIQRKTVFDVVNEIVVNKINSGRRKNISSQELVKEVCLEMDNLSRIPCHDLDDEDAGLIRILTSDTKNQSEDWTAYNGEIPALGLDIERLIFKDLINEVVRGEVVSRNWLKTPTVH